MVAFDKDFIKNEFNFADKTIQFMQFYLYSDDLREKLFNSIVKK